MLPPLSSLQAFEAIARRRSFTLAASELNVTPSAVSHQVSRLEAFLGLRLFERSPKHVKLSAAGEAYLQRVAGALGAISAATVDARKGLRNSLYVHTSPSFASLWLMPRIARFTHEHPDVSLFLSSSTQPSNFELGQADLDVRYGVRAWPGLKTEPLFIEPVCPLASPAFLKRHACRSHRDLRQLPLIQSTVSVVQWTDWFLRYAPDYSPERFALRFDRAFMALDAAAQGLGVALESRVMAAKFLRRRNLKPLFDVPSAIDVQAHFAVYPPRHAERPVVVQFLEWLRREAAAP